MKAAKLEAQASPGKPAASAGSQAAARPPPPYGIAFIDKPAQPNAPIQRQEVDEKQLARPNATVKDGGDGDTVVVNGIAAFQVISAHNGGKPQRRISGGGGSYSRLKGKEYARGGNSVSWQFTIPLAYTEEVVVSPIPAGKAALEKLFPSVNIVTAVKVVSDKPPPLSPVKLAIAQQRLGLAPPEPNMTPMPDAGEAPSPAAQADPQYCDATLLACDSKPQIFSPFDIGPRADVAMAEQMTLADVAPPVDLAADAREAFRYGGKAPNPDEVQWSVPGDVPRSLRKYWVPAGLRDMKVGRDEQGYFNVAVPGVASWSANPHKQTERLYAGTIAAIQRGEAARQELEAYGGKPTINGQPVDAQQWEAYKLKRIREIRAEVNAQLSNLDDAVSSWNQVQQDWVVAASASHFFGGRSMLESYRIAQSAAQDLEIGLQMIRKARTETELAEGERYALGSAAHGATAFADYKEDVYLGGERTITGIKGVAVTAVAAVAAPALFSAAGGIAFGEAGFAAAGLGGQAWATGVSAVGSGVITGTLGGALESVDRGFSRNHFAKGFQDNFSAGFSAGLGAGSTALLKVGPQVTLSNLPAHMAINAGTNVAGRVVDAKLHGKALGDEKAGTGYWDIASGAGIGAASGVAGSALGGRLQLPKPANAAFQAGYDAAMAGLLTAAAGGSQEDIYQAMIFSGASGGAGALMAHGPGKPGVVGKSGHVPIKAAPAGKPAPAARPGVVAHGVEGGAPPAAGAVGKKAPVARYRRPPNKAQLEEAVAHFEKMAQRWRSMGVEVPELQANPDHPTAFILSVPGADGKINRINIGYNAAPARNPQDLPEAVRANAALSPRAAMSHEGAGHAEAHMAGRTQQDPVLEEFQASLRSALTDPDLPKSDRIALIDDAFARLGDHAQASWNPPAAGREGLKQRFRKPTKVVPPGMFLEPLEARHLHPAAASGPSGRTQFGIEGESGQGNASGAHKRRQLEAENRALREKARVAVLGGRVGRPLDSNGEHWKPLGSGPGSLYEQVQMERAWVERTLGGAGKLAAYEVVPQPLKRRYNCFAFTLGELSSPTQPKSLKVLDPAQPFKDVSAMYNAKGYVLAQEWPRLDFSYKGKPKIVVYGVVKDGKVVEVTHAAIQEADGKWSSKLGPDGPLIRHNSPGDLSGATFGVPVAVYEPGK